MTELNGDDLPGNRLRGMDRAAVPDRAAGTALIVPRNDPWAHAAVNDLVRQRKVMLRFSAKLWAIVAYVVP